MVKKQYKKNKYKNNNKCYHNFHTNFCCSDTSIFSLFQSFKLLLISFLFIYINFFHNIARYTCRILLGLLL